jgi:serine phosphatase RsbU (regulator of sigma subunit)
MLDTGAESSRSTLVRWVTTTFSGRALALGAAIKLVVVLMRMVVGNTIGLAVFNVLGDIALVAGAAILAWRLFVDLRRVVLWRVRRKLTLSYIFIGFIPALLIIVFFVITGVLLLNSVSAFVIHNRVSAMEREAASLAQIAASELKTARDGDEAAAEIARLQAVAASEYSGVSYAIAQAQRTCAAATPPSHDPPAVRPLRSPLASPGAVPSWVPCTGFTGLVTYLDGPYTAQARGHLAARAIAWPDEAATQAVIVTLPLTGAVARQMAEDTGVELRDVSIVISSSELTQDAAPVEQQPPADDRLSAGVTDGTGLLDRPIDWVAFFDATDWQTGHTSSVAAAITTSVRSLSRRLAPVERVGTISFGQVLITLLAVVGGLFLVIQVAALVMGLALARSITGSVHELFVGTERVRRGDFTHKIPIRSRDQLGELAESFNSMTSSIEELLQQKAEKERLEQELRIARKIQMSLLPQSALSMPGLSLTAHCEPAREVGGDYYDFLPIGDKRVALLIADVAGKGTSAALYMAELKGIVLSLAERHASPRELMLVVNRILARHLDTRSFITMIYAVVDLEALTLTYTRAGHCPLIYLPGPYASNRSAQVLLPDGMVVGLNLDNGELFERQLEEATLPLGPGDLCLLYTDGITEASNSDGDYFGEGRLGELCERHCDLTSEELRERILREVRGFTGSAVQQDDMTMLILKTEAVAEAVTF